MESVFIIKKNRIIVDGIMQRGGRKWKGSEIRVRSSMKFQGDYEEVLYLL